jgi:hypothetical protein
MRPAPCVTRHACACTARGVMTVEQAGHAAEPEAGSFRTADGREADLFTFAHYPVDAVCQVCRGVIRAQSFVLPFEHVALDAEQHPQA